MTAQSSVKSSRSFSSNAPTEPTKPVEEIIRYFDERTKRLTIRSTTQTPSGQIIDWIPVESQLANGAVAKPPSASQSSNPLPSPESKEASFELTDPAIPRGPAGTVPVSRKSLSKLSAATSLQQYLSKPGGAGLNRSRFPQDAGDPNPFGFFHGYAGENFGFCYGCDGFLNVWDPYTQFANDHSIMQTWLQNYDNPQLQSIETGWTVDPHLNGDLGPHFFTYYTTNGYTQDGDNLGGYNQDVDGWVQYDNVIYPGALITGSSVQGGSQVGISIKFQLYQGNWWLQVMGRWVGYYPSNLFLQGRSVFGTLGNFAEWVGFGGEVYSEIANPNSTLTVMGSGLKAELGKSHSCLLSNLRTQNDPSGAMINFNGSPFAENPGLFDVQAVMNSGTSLNSYLFAGGPFPPIPFSSIAMGRGNNGKLQVFGLGQNDGLPYLFWQDTDGTWHWAGVVSDPQIPFSAITTATGNGGQLQVIGLGKNDGLPYLMWQDTGGFWHWVGVFSDPGIPFSSITTGIGNDGQLQVIGLGRDDGLPYLIWQDPNGTWHWVGVFSDPGIPFSSITTGMGNGGQLQVIALGRNDGLPYLIWQDSNGTWHWVGVFSDPGIPFSSITTGMGNGGQLQVIALGRNDGLPYLIWQDADGTWHWVGVFSDPGIPFSAITTGNGNAGQLQVIGIGRDNGFPYLIWQDSNGGWHWIGLFSDPSVPFNSIAAGNGNSGLLQVIGLGDLDGFPYLIWQDAAGSWFWADLIS